MANKIQLRRDTTANWNNVNPILADGEPGLDITTNQVKYGDGANAWVDLSYASGGGGTSTGNTLVNGSYTVGLGSNGILTLPFSSTINDTPDAPGSGNGKAVEIKPGGVSHSNQLLRIYATVPSPDANHLHLTSGDLSITDLFLGDDNQFVKIAADGNVCIGTYGTSGNIWQFGTDGTLTLPTGGHIDTVSGTGGFKLTTDGQIQFASGYSIGGSDTGLGLRMATDRGTILFGNHPEIGTVTHFHIMKQDPYYVDLFLGDDFNYVKLKGNENIAPSQPYGVEIGANDVNGGDQQVWRFGTDGSLTMPLHTKLNSGGVGNTNSAEFGTVVNTYTGNGVVENSQIYMSAGTGEARILVNMQGHTLVYYGTEEVDNPNFTGIVAMDPGVRSQYAIALDSNSNIILGGAQPDGTLVSSDYIAGIGSLNSNYNLNGLYVDTMRTVVSAIGNVQIQTGGGNIWAFGADGNLTLPAGGEIHSSTGIGNVVVQSNDGANSYAWTFGTSGTLCHPVLTVATLPSATVAGQRVFVSDADGVTRPVFDQIVTAGGAGGPYTVPVWSDGTNWRVG